MAVWAAGDMACLARSTSCIIKRVAGTGRAWALQAVGRSLILPGLCCEVGNVLAVPWSTAAAGWRAGAVRSC